MPRRGRARRRRTVDGRHWRVFDAIKEQTREAKASLECWEDPALGGARAIHRWRPKAMEPISDWGVATT